MKKGFLAFFLAGILAVSCLAGCQGSSGGTAPAQSGEAAQAADTADNSGKTYKIGLSMPMRDQFQTSMEQAIIAKAKNEKIDLAVLDANNDVATQLSHVQTWEADGYDAVIVGLCNNDSAQDILGAAGEMKVIFVNRQPDLSVLQDGKVVYVGTDENLYGQNQGKFLVDYFKAQNKTEINAVLFQGTLGLDNVTKRTNSVKDALKEGGLNVTYVYENTAEWDRMNAMNQFSQFMGSGKQVDAVICNNDEMALGCIEAMKTNGDGTIFCPVVGIDATDVGCEAVKNGELSCTVFQDPVAQGEGTVLCALGLLRGEPVENLIDNYYNITPKLVTMDNVDEFIKK